MHEILIKINKILRTNHALLPLKEKITRFVKSRSRQYCFETFLKIRKTQKNYQRENALQAF